MHDFKVHVVFTISHCIKERNILKNAKHTIMDTVNTLCKVSHKVLALYGVPAYIKIWLPWVGTAFFLCLLSPYSAVFVDFVQIIFLNSPFSGSSVLSRPLEKLSLSS